MLQSQEYIGLLISAARKQLRQAVAARARAFGVTAQEFWILVAAGEMQDASLGELAERQRFELPTASRVVATLVKRGLLRLGSDDVDRRRARISLTASGAKLSAELQQVAREVRGAVIAGMSASEQAALRGSLQKVIENLDRYVERTGR